MTDSLLFLVGASCLVVIATIVFKRYQIVESPIKKENIEPLQQATKPASEQSSEIPPKRIARIPTLAPTPPLEESMSSRWKTPISSTVKDFPRLVKKISIYDSNGQLIEETQHLNTLKTEEAIYDVLVILASQLGDTTSKTNLETNYWSVVDNTIDTGATFGRFFQTLSEESKLVRLTKMINQGALFPAVIKLKQALMKLPYKDSSNAWNIDISFTDNGVLVTHKRTEMSFNTPDKFDFDWHFVIHMNKDLTSLISATLHIQEVRFDESVSEEKRNEVQQEMKHLCNTPCVK